MQVVRSLSFRRRGGSKRRSNRPTDGPTPSESANYPGVDIDESLPLRHLSSMVLKKHQTARTNQWSKRWFEVDDTLGVMYVFKSQADQARAAHAASRCHLFRAAVTAVT